MKLTEETYDQPINYSIKQYEQVRKVSIGQGGDYATACLLDSVYFKNNCRLIAVYLSKQRALDAGIKSNSTDYFYW